MSEDRAPPAPDAGPAPEAEADAAPAPAPEADAAPLSPAGARRSRRRLWIALAAVVTAIGLAVVLMIARPPRAPGGASPPAVAGSGGAAIRAPAAPLLSDDEDDVRVHGTVVDGAGLPVAGAEVSAELERSVADRAAASAGARAGAPDAGAGSPTAEVHVGAPTAADGAFRVGGLVPGRYRLRVSGPGLVPAEVRFVPVPADALQVIVARQVQIDGVVLDGTTPVANATVGLRGEAIGGTLEARTDATGAFRFPDLPEGRYQVYAWRGALAARAVRVNRLGSGPFSPVELRLEGGAIVVGRVLDREAGVGLVAAVELRPLGDDEPPRYARSGDDGVFRIEGVPHGEWVADAFAPGYTSPGGIDLEAGQGIPELALIRGGTVEGRVVDGEGRPIAGATVRGLGSGANPPELSAAVAQDRLRRFSGRMSAPTPTTGVFTADPTFIPRGELGVTVGPIPAIPPPGATAARTAALDPASRAFVGEPEPLPIDPARASIWTTGPDGRYRITGVPRGKLVVLATAPGLAEGRSRQITAALGTVVDGVDIVLSAGTRLVGRVTDQHGVPIVGAQIRARPELGAPLDTFSEPDGSYALGPVTGTVELVATAFGHADARRRLELAPATGPAPATERADLVLAVADAILAGTLDDATGATVAGAEIEIVGGTGAGRRAVTAADGTFAIDMLPAGAHRVRVTHADYPPATLEARATPAGRERARLRLPLGGRVEGVLLDGASGAPLPGIALTGDGPGDVTAEATSDPTGRWALGPLVPGRWKLRVAQPGFLPLAHDLDVPAARAPGVTSVRDVRLELARGALLGGTVRDARGARLAGATVSAQAADGTGPTCEGTTNSAGEFRIRDCPTGDLLVTGAKGDARGSTATTLRAGDEVLGLALELR